ncbi:MAG TPA: Ig domain-containing protein, partial [Acidimicrobiales bacterium]|nr:Ig domain-containing protein [Acidimicrobiales bacterium]
MTPSAATASTTKTPFPATGYFSIGHKYGRDFFVTPTGEPFYSTGIDHVSSDPDTDQSTGQCPYCQTIQSQYSSISAWATATVSQLRSWGFNSLGAFSDDSTFASQMPYSVQLGMASGNDWFAPSFVTNADEVAATQVAPLADDPNLIGWYTDSELDWGPNGSDSETQLDHYLALPAGSPGLAVAQQYAGNPNGFVYALATRYFQATTAAIRLYDPHHLILGVKAEGQEIQPELLEAASPYVDVFSIDDYQLMPGFAQIIDYIWPQYLPVTATFNNFEKYVKRPIMVAEYSFIGSTPQTPDTVPGVYAVYPDQTTRTAAYTDYIAPLYEYSPWIVGDEWFEYVDEPQGGRFDGENNNFGVVDVQNQPYQDLVTQMGILHSIAPDRIVQAGPACDSWSDTSTGVACTAYMPQTAYPLSIFTTALPAATQGTKYSNYVVTIGGRPRYTFSLAAGDALPEGLRLNTRTGLVSGNPKVYGTFTFTVTAVDSMLPAPQTASQTESITIAPKTLVIHTTKLHQATVGKAFSATLVAQNGAPPYTWTTTVGSLPPGL